MANFQLHQPYTGPEIYPEPNYYIHKHIIDIGRANKGLALSQDDLSKTFNALKGKAVLAVKQQYRNLFKASLVSEKMDKETLKMLDFIINDDNKMAAFSQKIGQALLQSLATDKMTKLMQQKLNIMDEIRRFTNSAKNSLNFLNKVLNACIECSKLLKNDTLKAKLIQALINIQNVKPSDVQTFGTTLMTELNRLEQELSNKLYSATDINQMLHVMHDIKKYLGAVSNPDQDFFTSKEKMRRTFLRIFEDGFSQAISGEIQLLASSQVKNYVKTIFSGKSRYKATYFDSEGNNPVNDSKELLSTISAWGKADIIFEHITFQFKKKDTSNNVDIVMNLGISDKFYANVDFKNVIRLSEKKDQLISGGKSGPLKNMLFSLFGNDKRSFYLSYNTLAFGSSLPTATASLQDIITTRAIVNLFSSRGGSQDFAQYIFVNNKIISIWDIIMAASNTFVGYSRSQSPVNQVVVLSTSSTFSQWTEKNGEKVLEKIEHRVAAQNQAAKNPLTRAQQIARIKIINQHINSIYISAQLNLKALEDYRKSNYKWLK